MLATVAFTEVIGGLGEGERGIPRGVFLIVTPVSFLGVSRSVSDTRTAGKAAFAGEGMTRVSG